MKAALVTGAGTGIGRATAILLATRGLYVLCAGRTQTTLDVTLARIRDAGGQGEDIVADCGNDDGMHVVAKAIGTRRLDALVFSAGLDIAKPFSEISPNELDAMLGTNLRGPFFLTQKLLPNLTDNAGVVFVGSVSARHGRDRHAGYGASKASLIGLTVNLAAELAPRIRVNCVSPGATRTGMLKAFIADSTRGLSEQQLADVRVSDAARMLLGRVANPDEVATSIVHLALDATATTGIDLPVDVGYSAS